MSNNSAVWLWLGVMALAAMLFRASPRAGWPGTGGTMPLFGVLGAFIMFAVIYFVIRNVLRAITGK